MRTLYYMVLFLAASFLASCGRGKADSRYAEADSLNRLSYALRYKDLSASMRAATRACELADGNAVIRVEALNNMGFCAFMQMDFKQSARLFHKALSESSNEIEHLISDVGLMKIYQRTSQNKLFYDYRNSAQKRMARIREDERLITDAHARARLNYAISEFYIVSGIYFYYLQQHEESIAAIDSIKREVLEGDTAQWLYYEYMRGSGGMYQAETREKTVEGEFGFLADCLMLSREKGYIYFEANALQAMAEALTFPGDKAILEADKWGILRLVNDKNMPVDSLPLYYANNALRLFKRYGDWYQISGAYRTIATCYNYYGEPAKALANMKRALQYVNKHHEKYYHCKDTTDRLYAFAPTADTSTELKWIAQEGIETVPEWILRLREQLSCTYAAMGCKQESDYNRNIYLDLLDFTRQDKALESRFAALERESNQLNALLSLVVGCFVILIALFVVLNRRWRKKNHLYMERLKLVSDLCRKVIAAIPLQATAIDDVVAAVSEAIKDDLSRIFGVEEMRIVLPDESPEESDRWDEKIELTLPGTGAVVGWLFLVLARPLSNEGRELLRLSSPYLAWALENGLNLVSLEDECRRLEKERYVHQQHLAENKRQNVVKKACVSVVTGILPYIDRIVNEVEKLKTASYAVNPEVKRKKIGYIDELITRINEYNEILSLWIKMRRGALSLHIENFALRELFTMVAKGKQSFDMKRLHFSVDETDAMVKADKALTLFMINTLTENARKYTQEGGHVSLSALEQDNYVEISVADDGPGLSEADVNRILHEKVYDSGNIGLDTTTDISSLRQKKGFGFGLMNCRGIIDKYRKTNELFSVCRFDVESTPGKGSRFSFRLPKGMGKSLAVLGFLFISLLGMVGCSGKQPAEPAHPEVIAPYDSLLAIANDYANYVYECNVKADYGQALVYADSVLRNMNMHYLKYSGRRAPLLKLRSDDYDAAEQQWLSQGFDTDYYILLDVRNEAAVAALALNDFELYYYNNLAYNVLYKQISQDRSLEGYCEQMQQSSNNKMIALAIFVLLVLSFFVAYYLLYIRRRQRYRYNMEQVFTINKAIFSATTQGAGFGDEAFGDALVRALLPELNELMPITGMVLGVYDEDASALRYFSSEQGLFSDEQRMQIQYSFVNHSALTHSADTWSYFYLDVRVGGEMHPVGVLAVKKDRWRNREEDRLLVELVMDYLAVVVYNAVIRVKQKVADIELAQDEARRTLFEENMLHVQNLVLDNCLSTIKHETIYYPTRMKMIIDSLNEEKDTIQPEVEQERLKTIGELVEYYKGIFTVLTSCALRQLDEKTFRRTDISAGSLIADARKYFGKVSRKLSFPLTLEAELPDPELTAVGDKVLLSFLFENLINESARHPLPGILKITCRKDERFVRFDFVDTRRTRTQEELNELFYPSLSLMDTGDGAELVGTEYLLCKQIIREHDEFGGRRGCRINASVCEGGGFSVWFTVPLK